MNDIRKFVIAAAILAFVPSMAVVAEGVEESAGADRLSDIGFNASGLPITNEEFTLRVGALALPWFTKELNDFPVIQDMQRATNVAVEWVMIPSGDGRAQKVNLMFAAGETPDVFFRSTIDTAQKQKFIDDGLLMPMDELIDSYGPNIARVFELFPAAKFAATESDGNIYSTPAVHPWPPKFWQPGFTVGINQEWLDRLDLPMPDDIEQFADTMRAFKERDANGNGEADEIPVIFAWSSQSSLAHLLHPFGVIIDTGGWQVEDGEVVFSWTHPGMKDAVIWLHDLYRQGLINEDGFSITYSDLLSRARKEPRIVGVFNGWGIVNVVGDDAYLNGEYTHMPPLKGPDGQRHHGAFIDRIVGADLGFITADAEYPEVAMRYLDHLYDERVNIEISWGPIEWTGDTTFKMQDIPPGQQAAAFRNNTVTPKNIMPAAYIGQQYTVVDPPLGVDERTTYSLMVHPFTPQENFPTGLAKATVEEGKIMQQYGTDIIEFANRKIAEFIFNGGAEAGWDEYVETVERMGLDRLIEVQQAVYDRFKVGLGGDTSAQ